MSRLSDVLREYRLALDSAHEHRARSQHVSKEHDTLDIVEKVIPEAAKALLEDLGEHADSEEMPEMIVTRASAAVAEHGERFADDAPVQFFARRIEGLSQVLRDIGYLREGFGLGSDRPQPADMKWTHVGAVESYVWKSMGRVANEIKSDSAEVHRLKPEADLDLGAAHRGIVELLSKDIGPTEFMAAAIDLGKRLTKAEGWDAFRDLPFENELSERSSFFLDVVTREPPTAPLVGFYAGISYPSRRGETVADLHLMGSDTYHPNEEEWFAFVNYTPKDSFAHSKILASIYRMAYVPGGLGNAADFTLCLAWGTYLARACARHYLAEVRSDFIGVRAGFDSGDWIDLGWVRPA